MGGERGRVWDGGRGVVRGGVRGGVKGGVKGGVGAKTGGGRFGIGV